MFRLYSIPEMPKVDLASKPTPVDPIEDFSGDGADYRGF
jgi:hypothetical protein